MNLPSTNKSLGQHWLTDKSVLQEIIAAAEVTSGEQVLEIGPGPGTLTEQLLACGAKVTVVEFDESLAERLQHLFPDVAVYSQDILKFNFGTLTSPYKVVANIPYYLTSKLIRVLSESNNPPVLAALLIQKEVAERVCAAPGDMSLLSVSAQYYWETTLDVYVPAALFTPPPKVDSQVVVLRRRNESLFGKIDEKRFFQIVKAGFSNRRKTLLNSLSAGLHLSKDDTKSLLEAAEINPTARPQETSLKQWHNIYKEVD